MALSDDDDATSRGRAIFDRLREQGSEAPGDGGPTGEPALPEDAVDSGPDADAAHAVAGDAAKPTRGDGGAPPGPPGAEHGGADAEAAIDPSADTDSSQAPASAATQPPGADLGAGDTGDEGAQPHTGEPGQVHDGEAAPPLGGASGVGDSDQVTESGAATPSSDESGTTNSEVQPDADAVPAPVPEHAPVAAEGPPDAALGAAGVGAPAESAAGKPSEAAASPHSQAGAPPDPDPGAAPSGPAAEGEGDAAASVTEVIADAASVLTASEPEPVDAPPAPAVSSIVRPIPRILAIANQKGGVGKTTTAVNLGAALAELGYRVLVVDLDPQGNATTGLGINPRTLEASVYDVIMHDTAIEDCIEPTSLRNLFVVPATIDLAGAEIELVPAFSRELKLRRALEEVRDDFDYTLIDCPPSLGLITVNGLAAATEVVVPIQCEYYALEGLGQLLRNVSLVQGNLNPKLEVSAIILTMFDARTKLADQVAGEVRAHFGDKVCRNIVPRTVRLSEAPSFGQPIIVFDPSSRGAIAYRELAKEVSGGAPQRVG